MKTWKEKHHILLNHEDIEYIIHYKNIKSIYVSIDQGQVIVKAPYYVDLPCIEETLQRHSQRLLDKLHQYTSYALYQDKGYVDIFDQRYTIVLRDVNQRRCQIHGTQLYVYHCDIEKTVNTFLKQLLYLYIEERIQYYLKHDFSLKMPTIVIKKYKSRWGSCYFKEQKVTFHSGLIHLPKDLIDYVIVHELTHFIEANHSVRFYHEIEKRMPDYQERIQRIKEHHV